MSHLQKVRTIAKERLDPLPIVLGAEQLSTGNFFRQMMRFIIVVSFTFIGLHSFKRAGFTLPDDVLTSFSYSIPLAIVGLFGDYIHAVFQVGHRSRKPVKAEETSE